MHSVVRVDEFPVSDKVALQLAGLQAQVLWGDASDKSISRYEEVESFLSLRIRAIFPNRTKEEWMKELFAAHREFGSGKSDLQAKVLYLTAVKQYPLYGGTFFDVQFKGFWAYPNRFTFWLL